MTSAWLYSLAEACLDAACWAHESDPALGGVLSQAAAGLLLLARVEEAEEAAACEPNDTGRELEVSGT